MTIHKLHLYKCHLLASAAPPTGRRRRRRRRRCRRPLRPHYPNGQYRTSKGLPRTSHNGWYAPSHFKKSFGTNYLWLYLTNFHQILCGWYLIVNYESGLPFPIAQWDVVMAINFRGKIGKIGLFTFIRRPAFGNGL